ncbi:MAG TPA: FliM/FliN family flagellar motor C-terminal domain-containing protein [Bryobacteraceae bacterium]|jgi:flagellar motor switch protein FliN/FliY
MNTSISVISESAAPVAEGTATCVSLDMFDSISDVEVPVSAELDRRTVSVRELLRWQVDEIITLNRATGENVDLFAGNVLIGNAEILIVEDKLAIRVADLKDKPSAVQTSDSAQEA